MADSATTKRALAAAMKQLMSSRPFEKINVSDICEICGMNRKSFYYHFQDKYDLVNWIFQTEYIQTLSREPIRSYWDVIERLCNYLYDNRRFYYNAFSVKGQNSFTDYFRETMEPVIAATTANPYESSKEADFAVAFYTDALMASMIRWLSQRDCMPAAEYCRLLRSCLRTGAIQLTQS